MSSNKNGPSISVYGRVTLILIIVVFLIFSAFQKDPLVSVDGNDISFIGGIEIHIGSDIQTAEEQLPIQEHSDPTILSNSSDQFAVQPVPCEIAAGQNLLFTIAVNDASTTTFLYRWQYSEDGEHWKNSKATTSSSSQLQYIAEPEYDGRLYRCVVTNKDTGEEFVSDTARLVVHNPIVN